MAVKKDLYNVLGVARDSSRGVTQSAYRKLARQYHPGVEVALHLRRRLLALEARTRAFREEFDSERRKH